MPKAIAQFQKVWPLPYGVPAGSVVLHTRPESPRSITLDAVAVVRDIVASGMKTPHQRLFFYDHAGELDEVVVEHGEFVDFKSWTPEAPAPELVTITPETTLRTIVRQIIAACEANGIPFHGVAFGIEAKADRTDLFFVKIHSAYLDGVTFYGPSMATAINAVLTSRPGARP